MGPILVVVASPRLDDDTRFGPVAKSLHAQALVAERRGAP
jgi:hypothetical protein